MIIAICEDKKKDRDALSSTLELELARRNIDGEILAFASGEAMLDAMSGGVFPINFLDIYMSNITGVEVAREVRARDKNAAIVFTTSSRDHMAEGFDLGAAHYLLKPYTQTAVQDALDRCLRIVGKTEPFVEVTASREHRRVLLSKILWAESQDKSCILRLPEESLRVYLQLGEMLAQLADPRFLRCHKSFIVNLDNVAYIENYDFVMKDGSLIPIRREERARIKKLFEDYCFKKQRSGG